jgi:hypothetical protein
MTKKKIAPAEEFKEGTRSIYKDYSKHLTKTEGRTRMSTGSAQSHFKMCSVTGHHYTQKLEIHYQNSR